MKRTSMVWLIGASFAAAAWAQAPVLSVKGAVPQQASTDPSARVDNRTVNVILRLYDRQVGGTLLFEEQQTAWVDDAGIFDVVVGSATRGGVPARITDQRGTVWGEYVISGVASAVNVPAERQQITYRKTEDLSASVVVTVPTSTVLCYSCGGAWPYTSGVIRSPFIVNGTYERYIGCSGSPIYRTDSAPRLCSRD